MVIAIPNLLIVIAVILAGGLAALLLTLFAFYKLLRRNASGPQNN